MTPKLGIIGRERMLVNKLAKSLHETTKRRHGYGPIRETARGASFEVFIYEGDEPTDRIARVTVEFDRVERVELDASAR